MITNVSTKNNTLNLTLNSRRKATWAATSPQTLFITILLNDTFCAPLWHFLWLWWLLWSTDKGNSNPFLYQLTPSRPQKHWIKLLCRFSQHKTTSLLIRPIPSVGYTLGHLIKSMIPLQRTLWLGSKIEIRSVCSFWSP